jgi:hypothetical protein
MQQGGHGGGGREASPDAGACSGQALLLRRAVLAEGSPVASFDLRAALLNAFRAACAHHTHTQLLEVRAMANNI